MSTVFESEIRLLLFETGDPAIVAEKLVKRWDANVLTDSDVQSLTRFMLNAGQYSLLLLQIRRCIKKDLKAPWSVLAELIGHLELEPIEIDALFEGIAFQSTVFETDLMFELADSFALDHFDSRIAEFRKLKSEIRQREHLEKRADLQRQLEYARLNRLMSQEKRLLDEIQAFDPSDLAYSREKNLFEYREAQEIVENALAHSPPKSELESKFSQLSPELLAAAKPIVKRVRELAQTATEPQLYDLALMLVFMDLYDEAVSLLQNRRPSSRVDWLFLEILILGRHFAAALGEVENLEVKYAGDSEAPFALTYARARALWGLGDTVTAIELLKSLSRVRPSYRSAGTLLQQWNEEAP